jgi:asparagine synthase (glutamine-hydrolysing)
MAGIAGIFHPDGRPAELEELQRMTAAVEHRGADGITYWSSGPVALAHMQFFTTAESLHERQPLVSPGGEACLVWNGQLDNRDELKADLAAADTKVADETDPGLVLAAYLQWGSECVQRMVGDFALAVWDARMRRLWCACDYVGVRPFYYFWDGKTFVFGPDVRAMLAHPLVSLKINEGMVGEFLIDQLTSREETLYTDIRRLMPGCTLTIGAHRKLRVEPWWRPDLSLLTYRSDDEYAEHFRHVFDESVRSKMRSHLGWGIELSGGLDSSSIAVSARAILDESEQKDSRVLTYSIIESGKAWDESDDIRAVVKKGRLTAEMLKPLKVGLDFFRERAGLWRDYPGSPNGEPMTLPMYEATKRQGARVLFTGIGGDELLDGRDAHLMDLATGLWRQGSLSALTERAQHDWRAYRRARNWQILLVKRLVSGLAPEWARVVREKQNLFQRSALSREFLQRTQLAERVFASPNPMQLRFESRAQREVYFAVMSGHEAHVLAWSDRETAPAGIESRFPFLDRRLVEFCLRLPEEQRQRGATTKYVLRNAMVERLAERVQRKVEKAEFSELFDSVFSTEQGRHRIQDPMMLSSTDWIDAEGLRCFLRAKGGLWRRWNLIAIDLWLEQVIESDGSKRAK